MKLLLIVILSCMCGCSAIRGACATALPTITASQSYASDARSQLDQVKALEIKGTESALAECEQALSAVDASLVAASSACSEADPVTVFVDFIIAWDKLEPLITQLAMVGLARRPGTHHTPLIVLKARGAL